MHITLGRVGSLLLSAILWFATANLLMPENYGHINWLISVSMLASTGCVLGWRNTIDTFYPKEGKDEFIGGAVFFVLVASLGVALMTGYFINFSRYTDSRVLPFF